VAGERHLGHAQRLEVGDAQAVHLVRRQPKLRLQTGNGAPAAVYDEEGFGRGVPQLGYAVGQRAQEAGIAQLVTANFQNAHQYLP
jgi:hypothetical protein